MLTTTIIRLNPSESQYLDLMKTLIDANNMRNAISDYAWERKVFVQRHLEKETKKYFSFFKPREDDYDEETPVAAPAQEEPHLTCNGVVHKRYATIYQQFQHAITAVAARYSRLKKKSKAVFEKLEPLHYNKHSLLYYKEHISIWTVAGRLKIPVEYENSRLRKYFCKHAELIFVQDPEEAEGVGQFMLVQITEMSYKTVSENLAAKFKKIHA